MFAYRIAEIIDKSWDYMPTLENMLEGFDEDTITDTLQRAMNVASKIGWDSSVKADYHYFFVPTEKTIALGVTWRDENDYQWVASPVQLPHLMQADPKKQAETRSNALGRQAASRREAQWRFSNNGNPTTQIRGYTCTVFRNRRGPGYAGIISSGKDAKIFTDTFDTEDDVKNDIEENLDDYASKL